MNNIYFQNYWNDEIRLIGMSESDLNAVMRVISEFCQDHQYNVPYIRTWDSERDGQPVTMFDVGSHHEFFFTSPCVELCSNECDSDILESDLEDILTGIK